MPESRRHLDLRTFLYGVLRRGFGGHAAVGSDQFVYFVASNPRRCLAPDAFVRLGSSNAPFDSWKTWERGTPELAIEIVSPNDGSWEDKLADYHDAGFREVVRFDADAAEGARLRVWDRLEGDLVERIVERERTPCAVLGGAWVLGPVAEYPVGLRLEDEHGRLWESPEEAYARAEEERLRAEEERLRAERRVAELEEELARRGGR